MVTAKKEHQQVEEQKWEDQASPEKPADDRDKEQLQRQYNEAKRRHDNLTEINDNNKKTDK